MIDEIVPKPIKPATPVPQKKQANGDKEPVLVKSLSSSKSETAKAEGKIEPFDLNKKKEEKLSLEEYINRGFENVKNIKVGSKHPKKDKVTCEQVFSVVPNFKEIISEYL